MARYIDADALQRRICGAKCGCEYEDCGCEGDCMFDHFIFHAPTADVVPKSEVERLQAENEQLHALLECGGVFANSIEDWQTFLNEKRAEVAREIFEEIYEDCFDQFGYIDYEKLAELKKKYEVES